MSSRYVVRVVKGKEIRDSGNVEFIGGGNPYIYDFVPFEEIWLEDLGDTDDMRKIFAHEMIESILMRDLGWTYDRAHDVANKAEGALRKGLNPGIVFGWFAKKYFGGNPILSSNLGLAYRAEIPGFVVF